tara:strand:+ start:2563 stop:2778 length:216 start_codon:yes stop_codon:yes gene_type:complete
MERPNRRFLAASLLKNSKILISRVATTFLTTDIESVMLFSEVLKSGKKRQEIKNDLLSNTAPPLGLEPRTL